MINDLCTETGYVSLNHVGEQLCGDRVETVDREGESILVLADGLGGHQSGQVASRTAVETVVQTCHESEEADLLK